MTTERGIRQRDSERHIQTRRSRETDSVQHRKSERVSKEVKEKEREMVKIKKVKEAGGGRRGRVVGEDHVL